MSLPPTPAVEGEGAETEDETEGEEWTISTSEEATLGVRCTTYKRAADRRDSFPCITCAVSH